MAIPRPDARASHCKQQATRTPDQPTRQSVSPTRWLVLVTAAVLTAGAVSAASNRPEDMVGASSDAAPAPTAQAKQPITQQDRKEAALRRKAEREQATLAVARTRSGITGTADTAPRGEKP